MPVNWDAAQTFALDNKPKVTITGKRVVGQFDVR